MKKTILALLAVGATALFSSVYADTIAFQGSSSSSGDSSKASPTTVSFGTNWTVVATSGGLFSGVASGQAVNMHSFTFNGDGTGASCVGCPLVQWDFNNGTAYSFTLNSLINAATRPGSIAASGIGVLSIGGTNYSASWAMNGTGSKFQYKISFVTNTIPDGGSAVALLGIGLAVIEGVRRKIGARKA
jgi:hypothetical protein